MEQKNQKLEVSMSSDDRTCMGDLKTHSALPGEEPFVSRAPSVDKCDMTGREQDKYEEMNGNTTGRYSMKSSGNTHNNIFGDPPVSPRRAGKVYHMSSDIFGVGSIVDRAGTHLQAQAELGGYQAARVTSGERIHGESRKQGTGVEKKTSSTRLGEEGWKPNARENGCNPVTGDGYAEVKADAGKSQKRHYPRGRAQSLW